ncbi:MAG: ATP-grasp domain-containing protein [Deltaproteobacteria bacterium]|nr:ATP-grasp domain-containing protein [Deltaproteobacteria bacterium]
MKTLWIVSGGVEAVPGIKRAKELGLHVVVSDGDPEAPGFALADDKVLASTYDVEATIKAAVRYHQTVRQIDGVICIAADVPLTVASIAAELGLPGISLETARLASDKLAMKRCFAKAKVPIPWFSAVKSRKHLKELVGARGLPLVIKPVDSRGARGVLRLNRDVDLDWAFCHAREFSPTSRVMVEEYLPGPQVSTESILLDGVGFTPGFCDRNYEYLDQFAPFIIENGGQQPSILAADDRQAIKRCAEQAALAMGIRTGVAKGDMVLTPDGPKVIEIAARLSGGWFSTDQVPLGTGVDFLGAAICLTLGEPVEPADLFPKFEAGVAIRYFFPDPGRVVAFENIEEVRKRPWVHRLGFFLRPGDMVEPATNHTKRAGFVIATGETREQAVAHALDVVETIKIETVPE